LEKENGEWAPDMKNADEKKYYVLFSGFSGRVVVSHSWRDKLFPDYYCANNVFILKKMVGVFWRKRYN
jgi:hypothetical protein